MLKTGNVRYANATKKRQQRARRKPWQQDCNTLAKEHGLGSAVVRVCKCPDCASGLAAGFGVMTTILIILACAFYQILNVSVWLFIVMYALVRTLSPLSPLHSSALLHA